MLITNSHRFSPPEEFSGMSPMTSPCAVLCWVISSEPKIAPFLQNLLPRSHWLVAVRAVWLSLQKSSWQPLSQGTLFLHEQARGQYDKRTWSHSQHLARALVWLTDELTDRPVFFFGLATDESVSPIMKMSYSLTFEDKLSYRTLSLHSGVTSPGTCKKPTAVNHHSSALITLWLEKVAGSNPPSCLWWNLQNRQRYRLQYRCILPLCCSQPALCDSNKWRISVQKDQYCTLCLNASRAGPMLSCQLLLSCQNTSRTRLCGALKHAQAHPLLQSMMEAIR